MNTTQNNELDIFEIIPFLRSFPFDEYDFELTVEGVDAATDGISQILIDHLGTFGTQEQVQFFFGTEDAKVMISIWVDDILDIYENSSNITSLDSYFKILNESLESNSFSKKAMAIKKSRDFINSLDVPAITEVYFHEILPILAEASGVEINQEIVPFVVNLNSRKLSKYKITKAEEKVIISFLDFQLHYAMIILGIVIASKIHN